jgi:SAM-dependent methyltransferase
MRTPTDIVAGGYDTTLFNRLAEIEDQSFWFRARNRLIVQLVSSIAGPNDRFLEIGCGTGYVLQAVVHQCGLRGTGTELLSAGLEHARRRVPEANLVELDAREMPYVETFDIAGAFDVLEHIDDDLAALRGLHRAVRPSGHLVLTVPQHPWLWSAADTVACHVRRYRRSELIERVRAAGFTPIRVTSFVSTLLPLMALSRLTERLACRRSGYDPLDDLTVPGPINWAFEKVLDLERVLVRHGVSLPVGGSLVLVARRD